MAINRRTALLQLAALARTTAQPAAPDLRVLAPPSPSEDAALAKFLARLRSIVDARDAKALEALMSPVFRVDFDFGKGPAAFHRRWSPQSHESPVWQILTRILTIGGANDSATLFAAPYVFARFPIDLDLLGHVAAVWEDVPILPSPDIKATPLLRVSHAILPLAAKLTVPVTLAPGSFLEVAIPGHPPGFVSTNDVYSPADYRIFLEKRSGAWRWLSLVCATVAYPPDLEKLDKLHGTRKP